MYSNTELKLKGLKILVDSLGKVDAEKFIALIIQEPFDYTKWQQNLWEDKSVDELSDLAMKYRKVSD